MAIKIYKKGDSKKLSKNFRASEFDCQGSGCCSTTPIDEKLVEYLQRIRDHFGKPVVLTAYRCPVHNAQVANAASRSYHTYGQAADFHIDGVAPSEIAKYAESIGILGIGLYDTFVHIDTRTTKSFWYSHAQERRTTFGGAPVVKQEQVYQTKKTCKIELPVLTEGDSGDVVKVMQNLLITHGYSCGARGADGDFGASTKNALLQFKKARGLKQTVNCGALTWSALHDLE